MSILNKSVSIYPNILDTSKGVEVSLLSILESNKYKSVIEKLRNESNPTIQKKLKETLPCYTVAGVFKGRNSKGLIKPSGLAAVDLDSAENYDAVSLIRELTKLPYIAYAGLSCRGKRVFCIIPFATDAYEKHYERLIQSFEDLGLPMGDNCHKQISQPRFVSYNDENTHWCNEEAKSYSLLLVSKTYHYEKATKKVYVSSLLDPFKWCNDQINKSHSFIDGQRHNYIIQLARYCNIKGISEEDTLRGCLTYQSSDFSEAEIKNMVKYIYATQKDSFNKIPFNKK